MKVIYKKAGCSSDRSSGALPARTTGRRRKLSVRFLETSPTAQEVMILTQFPGAELPSVQSKQSRAALLALAIFILLLHAVSSRADTNWLSAKHENMKRFYDETHKPPPPTLAEVKAAAERGDAASQAALADFYNSKQDFTNALL